MSTKTLRKRIALVAVAGLGFGLLSATSASATNYNIESGITASTSSAGSTVTVAAAGGGIAYAGVCDAGTPTASTTPRTIAVGGTSAIKINVEVSGDAVTAGELRITGPAKFTGGTAGYVGTTPQKFTVSTGATSAADTAFYANFEVTGTGTVRIDAYSSDTDTSLTAADSANSRYYSFFFSGVAACGSGVSAATSYAQVVTIDAKFLTLAQVASGRSTGTFAASGSRTSTSAGAMATSQDEKTTFANAATAYITVNANNAQGYPYTTTSNAVVQCTNKATIEGTTGGYYVATSFAGYDTFSITQPTANAPFDTTCTVSIDGVVFATKTIKFLGDAASIKLVHYKSGNAEGSSSSTNDGQLLYYVLDSAGNELTENATPAITTATTTTRINTLTAVSASVGAEDAYNNLYGVIRYNCLDYGTQDLAVKMTNTALNSITSNTVSAHCGGAVNTYTASFDKAQYQTGDIATLTITAKDYAGGTTWTGTTLGSGTYGTFSVAVGGMTAVAAPVSTDTNTVRNTGVWTYSYKVDTTTGSYVAQVVVPVKSTTSANYNKPVLLQYKVVSSDSGVSNADVLKAIVSLIASINKQIAALQKALLKK